MIKIAPSILAADIAKIETLKFTWKNDQGLTFEKEISLDNEYLFTIKQTVINSTDKKFNFAFPTILLKLT